MKKVLMTILLFLGLALLLATGARGAEAETELESDMLDTQAVEEALSGDAAEAMEGAEISEDMDFMERFGTILESSTSQLGGMLKSGLRSAGLMIIITMFCAVLSTFYGAGKAEPPRYVHLVGTLGIAAVAVSDVSGFIGLGKTVLAQLSDFSRVLLPTLSSAAALSGAYSSAAAKYAASALFMEILITVSNNIVLPLIFAYVAALVGAAATGSEALSGVARLIKWAATTVLTITVTVFVTFLTLTGIVSSSSDAFTSRFVKSAVSTALPVVGGIISDAAGTIVSGAAILKNAVGIFGLLAVAAICLTPVLRLGVQYLIYKFAAGVSGVLADKRLSDLTSGLGAAFGLVLGMTGSCAMMLFISVISSLKAVSG